ncbi:hypothetical protein VIN01S_27320 [Vibrio inusitatus NBRC 102082]|uniref:Uncharacterized protein n=1 Tax=Vibrio inusitatus NBRC 102082 TaxID=1219070 RepID=A0A4Y3HY42_9VIBR|nr:hypothetical protein [Vibrio inusitatus]GEA51928.1 hypothetical protein VIN01S_27320 [Vibrio inusitatus NBRC 102082]
MLALATLFSFASNQTLPSASDLMVRSGQVSSLKYLSPLRGSKSIRLQLIDGSWYQYSSKSGDIETVYHALQRNNGQILHVGYVSGFSGSPVGDERQFYNVLSLKIGSQTLRDYQQIQDAWSSDNQLAVIMCKGLFIGGILLLVFGSALRFRGQ